MHTHLAQRQVGVTFATAGYYLPTLWTFFVDSLHKGDKKIYSRFKSYSEEKYRVQHMEEVLQLGCTIVQRQ